MNIFDRRERNTEFHYAFKEDCLTASCKRLISWFLLYKGTELGRKIVPVRPPKFQKGERKEVCCIFKANFKIRVKRFRNNFSGGRYPVRGLTLPIPKKQEGWNLFFSSLERSFKTKNVPDEFKGEILLNLLGEKAENILVYVKDEEISDYNKLKGLVLREFEPTPLICLQNFQKAKRMPNETHVQLASHLLTNWDQYCNLRNVNDFNSLKELIVSDKLYETLDSSNDEFGKITLRSAFGENVEAKLIKTAIALDNNSLNHPMDCLVAITDK
ncbi:transposon Ty3-I Gag-Pol polyprotein [Trichonephila clavipes]|nr:transposon Ty3-I Gag-Pol polyprotein [Trichonephila clavipes]